MEKCKFGFGDWSFLRISGKSFTQIKLKKVSRRFKRKRNADLKGNNHADLKEKERRFSFL